MDLGFVRRAGAAARLTTLGRQGSLGFVLLAVWWPIAWLQIRPISDYYFFPLWLGFVLALDGLVERRTGTSLWRRSHVKFIALFLASMPFWWIFEWVNRFVHNWHYVKPHPVSTLEYAVLASLSFSTVVPAVLEMTELLASFKVGERIPRPPAWPVTGVGLALCELTGWAMLAAVILWPQVTFPFAWLFLFFIIEPINCLVGQRSIGAFASRGNWVAIWNVMLATLATGFFWEMWNYFSLPKWYYTVPHVGIAKVFEMPLLGYLGYLPFGLELFAVYGLVFWLLERRPQHYACIGDAADRAPQRAELTPPETPPFLVPEPSSD